ncbi:MAG TPA: hypothetical protein VE994_05825, partial [Terriglobales bacterium]|nr:hypothetical protein [Terriglobales bacterium]
RAGVAEGVIQKIGGWKTRSVFERYNIVTQSDIQDAMAKLEANEKKPEAVTQNGYSFGYSAPETVQVEKAGQVN